MGHNLKDSGEHTLQFTLQDMLDQTRQNTQRKAPCLVALTGSALGRTFRLRQGRTVIGRSPDVDIQIDEDGISRRHTAVDWNDEAVVLSDLGSTNGTVCNGDPVSEPVLLNDGDRIRLASTVLRFERQDELDEAMRERLYELATKDPLTGAHNRRFLTDRLPGEWSWAVRHHNPCAVIAFDIDHFKVINDRYGHPDGDYVLRELARVVQGSIRREDVLVRTGGEEFVVLCRATNEGQARALAERLRAAVQGHRFEIQGQSVPVTLSAGVATSESPGVATPEQLVAAADAQLYRAKEAGRNRVEGSWSPGDG